tara:strand:- start:6270 stop:7028 length:759 start_codon:yes stop_codon:yes gene_type:complete
MQSRKIKKKDHLLFDNINEFNQFMPNTEVVSDWRDGKEKDWVLCDDGQVCQILKRNTLKKGDRIKYDYVRTVIGTFMCSGNYKMSGDMRKNMYTFSPKYDTAYNARKNRKKATKNEFLFAKYVAKGDDMVDAFMSAFPANSRKYAEKEAKFLMNTKRVKNLIREEIDKIMNEADITPLYILEKMKDIIESTTSRDSDKVSLLKELVSIAGMKDTDTKSESVTVFQGFSPEQLDAIGSGGNKKLASAKRELKS